MAGFLWYDDLRVKKERDDSFFSPDRSRVTPPARDHTWPVRSPISCSPGITKFRASTKAKSLQTLYIKTLTQTMFIFSLMVVKMFGC